jgi:RHS repeat-associated protein
VASYTYLPFGALQSSTGSANNPFQYNGQLGVMSQGNGLDFMRARFYSPSLGRFINPDPTAIAAPGNPYAYAGNNPVLYVDSTGLQYNVNPYTGRPVLNNPTNTNVYNLPENYLEVQRALAQRSAIRAAENAATAAAERAALQALARKGLYGLAAAGTLVIIYEAIEAIAIYSNDGKIPEFYDVPTSYSSDVVATTTTTVVGPHDPNYVSGPAGYGPQGFILPDSQLPYTVGFENEASATAPAHVVEVTQQLDPNLDWSTFQLGGFGFGGHSFSVPAGLTSYSTRLDDIATLGVYVDVNAQFDETTGQLTWTFTTIDPTTLSDPVGNVSEGFLPPNVTAPQGEGWVSYAIQPRAADSTGAIIKGQATVVFDAGLPDASSLSTSSISNAIDAGAPTSHVMALAATSLSSFNLTWSGTDDTGGSGISSFDIFFSDNGGAFMPFIIGTTATSATFTGVVGHRYGFYSIAHDNVGHVEAAPASADASTLVVPPAPTASVAAKNVTRAGATFYTFTVTYRSSGAPINTATIGIKNVVVSSSHHPKPVIVSFTKRPVHGNSAQIVVVYKMIPPGGSWDHADNGQYTIKMVAKQVKDTAGHVVAAGMIGVPFTVKIPRIVPKLG